MLAASVALLAQACARVPRPQFATIPAAADTVWYISARARVDGRDSRLLSDSLEFGFAVFARQPVADPARGTVELVLVDSMTMSEGAFAAALARRVDANAAPDDYAVWYVHGFGTSRHEVWTHAAMARVRTEGAAPWVVFSWPSNGSGVTWPRLDDLVTRAYRQDSAMASSSRAAYIGAQRVVTTTLGAQRVLLVAHSLGAQLVGEALAEDVTLRSELGAGPLRALAFVAPDVESRRFADYLVPAVTPLARRVLLYTSSRDRVLGLSRAVNESQRAGLHDGSPLVRTGLETVDVSRGPVAGGWLQRNAGNHHGIRLAAGALFDLTRIVGAERSGECRVAMGTATHEQPSLWRLTPAPTPLQVPAGEACRTAGR